MPLPLFKNAYKVKGLEIRNENVGCLDKPILFAISSGKVLGESLIFHLKIGNHYFDCHLLKVNEPPTVFSDFWPDGIENFSHIFLSNFDGISSFVNNYFPGAVRYVR